MPDPFAEHRRLLFSVAYNLLGSVADAEDVVQETWLRWSADDRADVLHPRAYLTRIVTTQALNRLRANRSRRETYIGPWLPEPLIEADPAEEIIDRAAREHDVSLAMLVVLETLSPVERAAFVLREVFGMPFEEVAQTLGRTPAAVRQLAHRAREHVRARRPRFAAEAAEQRRITDKFLAACESGDLAELMGLLAPDVTLISDGGGIVQAALRPIVGADKVGRFLMGIAPGALALHLQPSLVNGQPGLLATDEDGTCSVALLDVADGHVVTVYFLSNPEKLRHLTH